MTWRRAQDLATAKDWLVSVSGCQVLTRVLKLASLYGFQAWLRRHLASCTWCCLLVLVLVLALSLVLVLGVEVELHRRSHQPIASTNHIHVSC